MQDIRTALSFEPVQKTTLVESVMEQIIAQIRAGQLRPGDRLPSERALMSMMGVGRSTVREALQALAAINVIETHSGEGSRVKSLPALARPSNGGSVTAALERDMRLQLLEMRQVVETAVAEWAVERATDAEIAALKTHVDAYIQHTSGRNWPEAYRSHHAIHLALAEASHNVTAARVVDSLVATMPASMTLRYVSTSEKTWREEREIHQEIYEALRARDAARMRAAIMEHMEAERRQIMVNGHGA